MTNATMTRDEAATLYREARAQAVHYGYTAERFDAEVKESIERNCDAPTYADWVEFADSLAEVADHEHHDRLADMGSAYWGAIGGGMPHSEAFAVAQQQGDQQREDNTTGWNEGGW